MTCPSELELTRAITVGDDAVAAHVAGCARCRAVWDETQAAIELARELPVPVPSAAHREEMRTALLARAEAPTRRARPAWLVPAGALAVAAAVIGYLALPSEPSEPSAKAPVAMPAAGHHHGTVRPQPGARYLSGTPAPDEVVVLVDGALDVEVAPLHAGERYRVVVGSAEVEVRGTAFTVTAREARLVGVRVTHGRVEIRAEHGAAITLTAGQSWQPEVAVAPVVAAPTPPAPPRVPRRLQIVAAPHAAPSREGRDAPAHDASSQDAPGQDAPGHDASGHEAPGHDAPSHEAPSLDAPSHDAPANAPPAHAPPPHARAAEEVAYDDAWRALRTSDFARAASGFSRVLLLAPDSTLVEDASFWHAVALARAGRSAEAVSAFRDFLERYARSARTGEASAMLGWILVDRGDHDEALRRFRAGLGDANPAVRASAQAGLDALARRAPIKSSGR